MKKQPKLPPTPEFQQDPRFQQGIDRLLSLGKSLTSFDFSGDLSPLQQTIDLDPQITQLALQQAQASLMPEFNLQRQNTINELANLGALQSSTASNAFAQQDQNLQSQLQAITSGAALDDRQRALQNTLSLFGTGLDTTQTATGFAGDAQAQLNSFNLNNYQNQVAKVLGEQSNSGGLFGGLMGSAGGALAGLALAPVTGGSSLALGLGGGLLGGAMGSMGTSGTGGQLFNTGTMLAGRYLPGSTAGAGTKLRKRGQDSLDPLNNLKLNFPQLQF